MTRSLEPHRYRWQTVFSVLLAIVMCWFSERADIAQPVSDGPAVECQDSDTCPVSKPSDANSEGRPVGETTDDSDSDAIFAIAPPIEVARFWSFREFYRGHELNDWRVRSSIGARGPPIA